MDLSRRSWKCSPPSPSSATVLVQAVSFRKFPLWWPGSSPQVIVVIAEHHGEPSAEVRDDRSLSRWQVVLPRPQLTDGRILGMTVAVGLHEARVAHPSRVVGQREHARFFVLDRQKVTQRARDPDRTR